MENLICDQSHEQSDPTDSSLEIVRQAHKSRPQSHSLKLPTMNISIFY
ncbi:hypothetical protein CCACVL1_04660 [Corchorus capsularis]|uniref:Uncharacterized protein n=1 Tax=Corchorus capsularis TaxID=210143 RepID=A0A1R3JQD9_COCAP|nr:hypothetical protein CCACVL1_04660 [Corchorus capsularis]